MTSFSRTLAAAALATGLIAGAAATASAAAPATGPIDFGTAARQTDQAKPGTELAGYFYRYRCYYVRYGYRTYRRCHVRYYHY